MRRLFLFVPLALAVGLGIVLASGIGRDTSSLESALIGEPVPAFELATLSDPDGARTASVLQGEVQLLNVWGTWCPSCKVEHPELMRLAEEKGIPIIGLNYKDNREAALTWLKERGDPYDVTLFDPQGAFGFDLGVYGAPETYIIDANGIIRYRHVGVVNEQVWRETLAPVFEQYRQEG